MCKLKATIFSSYLLVWGFVFFPPKFLHKILNAIKKAMKKSFCISGLSENVTKTINF